MRARLTPDHEHIEEEEDARERKFAGLSPDAELADDHETQDPLDTRGHESGDGPEAYAAAGQGPDVGGGQSWEEQTAESGGHGAPAGVAGQTEGHADGGMPGGEPVEVDAPEAGEGGASGFQQQRFREARAGRKVPPRRMAAGSTSHKHRASMEERARADAPYSEFRGMCEREWCYMTRVRVPLPRDGADAQSTRCAEGCGRTSSERRDRHYILYMHVLHLVQRSSARAV